MRTIGLVTLCLIFGILLSTDLFSQSVNFTDSDLPIVVITTENNQPIPDDPRIKAHMGIIYNGAGKRNYLTDNFNDYDGNISIEIRGSTSQQYPKKSYGLETQDEWGLNNNVSLLNMPIENDWILYAPYPDKTMIRNVMTYHLARKIGRYASRTRYCELMINGEYVGVYVLEEKLKIDNDRVNIQELDTTDTFGNLLTGGYLIKVDKTTGSGNESWTSFYDNKVLFQYHDPDEQELLPVQKSYIEDFVNHFEDVMWGNNFTHPEDGYVPLINVGSFIDFFIFQELGRTVDGYRSSSFLYKDRESKWTGKLTAGPMWDFNLSYGNADYCDAYLIDGWQYDFNTVCPWFSSSVPFWWGKLLQDTSYANRLKCRWDELRSGPFHTDSLHYFIDSVADVLAESRVRNFTKWPIIGQYVNWNFYVGSTYQEDVDFLKQWIADRTDWMDNNIPGECKPYILGNKEPTEYVMKSYAWPNPFTNSINIAYTILGYGDVSIEIKNIAGKLLFESTEGKKDKGEHFFQHQSSFLNEQASGLYFYSVKQDGVIIETGKIIKQ